MQAPVQQGQVQIIIFVITEIVGEIKQNHGKLQQITVKRCFTQATGLSCFPSSPFW